jgi:hypothetical protein
MPPPRRGASGSAAIWSRSEGKYTTSDEVVQIENESEFTHHTWPTGRFLIRLSDSLFLAPQSDLEKKNQNAVRKGLARNAQIRGVFGSAP